MITALLLVALASAAPQDGGSLEDLRARLARQLESETSNLQPAVDAVLLEVVAARRDGSPRRAAEARARLAALPSAAALILVERIEVSDEKSQEQNFRALEAGLALRSVASAATLPRLVELASANAAVTRRIAIAAMGALPRSEAVEKALLDLVARLRGAERAEAVGALVRLGGPRALEAAQRAAEGRDGESLRAALSAATERGDRSFAVLVDLVLANSDAAKLCWSEVLDLLVTMPDLIAPARVLPLLGLPLAGAVRGDDAASLVERVGLLPIARRHVQEALDGLARSSEQRVATAARVALARLGDRNAEKLLFTQLDAAVDQAEDGDAQPLRQRGQMRIRLSDYAGAINDLKKALKEAKDGGAFVQREIHIDIARAYALNERLDKAAAALVDANLTNARREELAALPEFAALAAHPRHGEVLDRE